MDAKAAQDILDKIIGQIFGYKNPLTLQQFQQKFAFDVRLPQQTNDMTTGQVTWTQSPNPTRFMTVENIFASETMWEKPSKKELNTIQDVLAAWSEVNITAAERYLDSMNVSESDNIYGSENVYRSLDVHGSKNVIFCDAAITSEYVAAVQRSNNLTFCARVEDSKMCSNSFSVIWSQKIVNSYFIEDCSDMQDCMFCSHTRGKQYCIANMQYTEEEYRRIKDLVVRWILTA